jgi:PAS domain S-box-containing protein
MQVTPIYPSSIEIPNEEGERERGVPTMQVSAVIGEKVAPVGLLTLRLNVLEMRKELMRGSRFFEASGINSLDLYLIAADGLFLTPSAFEDSLLADRRLAKRSALELKARVPATGEFTKAAAHCKDMRTGQRKVPASDLDGYTGYRGIPVVGAWSPVAGTAWCVIAEVDEAEALAPVTRLLHVTLLVLLGIGAVFGFLALALSSTLTTPLTELTARAGKMAAGDWSVRFRLGRRDEIGLLAASFDRMAATIEQHLTGLEAKVQERTANLVAANQELEREILVRKRAEEALAVAAQGLRDNEQKFRTLVDNIPGAIYLSACDADWTMEFLSDAVEEIVGYPASDFLQNRVRSYASIIHPEDRVPVETAVQQGVSTRTPFIVEYRVLHADGSVRWVYEKGQGVFDPEGRLLWLDGAIFDITERKRVQQRLGAQYATTRVLAESATLAEAVPRVLEAICKSLEWEVGLLWNVDRDANVLRCVDIWSSPVVSVREFEAMSRRLAFPPGVGLPGRVWQEAKSVWVTDLSADPNFPRAPIAAAEGLRAGFGLPVSAGTEMVGVMEFFTRQVRQPDEEVLRMLTATGSQIGQFMERVRAQAALQEREEQLRQAQKMEAIGRLAGGIAHDFNNLLTAIMGYSQLLLRKLEEDDPRHRYASEIHQGGERAARLTGQLLAFSRKQVLQPRILDLNVIVTNLDLMLHRLLGEHIKLETVLEPGLGPVRADPGQVEQVLLNLAVNSRDAMQKGGRLVIETANVALEEIPPHVFGEVKPGSYVRLTVNDTGCGMGAETLEHIFEPFFTTKGREKGTGLGLATVYGIVRQSGGAVEVVSKPGRGTTFHVYLPRASGKAEVQAAAPIPSEPLRGSETILLVEDEVAVRSLACQVLEQNGYVVLEATNGGEALVFAEQHPGRIALLITDVVMPGMSGPDVAERLAALRPEIRVLYMSGYTDNAIGAGGVLEAGMAYLPKPFSPDALLLKVRGILDAEESGEVLIS